uniref:Alpha N-terminal protein methyltransferase 1 n=1 Tax=Solanum tuberosum TaxID=4113 RepID=M1B7Q6_SOLTU
MVSELHKVANFYCVPLQEFTPDAERYDVIWVQWCIGHLADDDFIAFFKRAKVNNKNPDKSSEEVGSRFAVESYEGYGQYE